MKTVAISMFTLLVMAASAHGQQATATAAAAPAAKAAKAAEPSYRSRKLTRAEFDTLLADPARLVLIDVRRPEEVAAVGGFQVYLSIPAAEVEQRLAWIPRDRTIVTVSNHANRSGRVGDVLTAKGFTVAGTIGVADYEAAGGTVIKAAPPSGDRSR